MERFYDGDQDQLFSEARVINPFRKPAVISRVKVKVCTVFLFYHELKFICKFKRDTFQMLH